MKVGDLVVKRMARQDDERGVIIEFPPVVHYKQVRKIRVLTGGKIEDWILQYCKVEITE